MSFQIWPAAEEFEQLMSPEVEPLYVIVVAVPNEALFAQMVVARLETGRFASTSE